MQDTRALALEVLRDSYLATLGTSDADGPWTAAITFIHDNEMNIYWLSQPAARHSVAIEKGSAVAVAITAEWESSSERALQMSGRAEQLQSVPDDIQEAYAQKRGRERHEQLMKTLERGTVWYRFTPSRIELIYGKHFGYNRQRVL